MKLKSLITESVLKESATLSYEQALAKIASRLIESYFNDQMSGSLLSPIRSEPFVQSVAMIFSKSESEVKNALQKLIKIKKADLEKNWSQATSGQYKF